MPTFGSLFAGIGGIDLGLERAGWECKWQVEIDSWCQRVLMKHWPDVPKWGPVETFPKDAAIQWGPLPSLSDPYGNLRVDLIAGGFPCQPVSVAGRRRGQDDERWLWPEFARIVRVLRPRLVLVENVPGLLARGMGDVLGGLAELGYDAEWASIPAAAVGALHLRYRVFIVAYTDRDGWSHTQTDEQRTTARQQALSRPTSSRETGRLRDSVPDAIGSRTGLEEHKGQGRSRMRTAVSPESEVLRRGDGQGSAERRETDSADVADSNQSGLEGRELQPERPGEQSLGSGGVEDANRKRRQGGTRNLGERRRTESENRRETANSYFEPKVWTSIPRPERNSWAVEPDVGRVAHGIPSRVDRLRGLGNAVVPQVAEWIGRRLKEVSDERS